MYLSLTRSKICVHQKIWKIVSVLSGRLLNWLGLPPLCHIKGQERSLIFTCTLLLELVLFYFIIIFWSLKLFFRFHFFLVICLFLLEFLDDAMARRCFFQVINNAPLHTICELGKLFNMLIIFPLKSCYEK